jgi:hypothetical protein
VLGNPGNIRHAETAECVEAIGDGLGENGI